jgi:hypothetical protein
MHLGGDGAGMSAGGAILRPQAGVRCQLVHVFGDRQRFPDHQVAMAERRYLARGRMPADGFGGVGLVERDDPSSKASPASRQASQPRSDHEE